MAKTSINTGSTGEGVHTRSTAGTEESQAVVLGIDGSDSVVPASVGGLLVRATGGTVGDGRKTVTTAGTRETLVGSATPCVHLTVQALTGNTGYVVIGGSTVVAAVGTRRGIALAAGEAVPVPADDVQKIYADVETSGEGVSFVYVAV